MKTFKIEYFDNLNKCDLLCSLQHTFNYQKAISLPMVNLGIILLH